MISNLAHVYRSSLGSVKSRLFILKRTLVQEVVIANMAGANDKHIHHYTFWNDRYDIVWPMILR